MTDEERPERKYKPKGNSTFKFFYEFTPEEVEASIRCSANAAETRLKRATTPEELAEAEAANRRRLTPDEVRANHAEFVAALSREFASPRERTLAARRLMIEQCTRPSKAKPKPSDGNGTNPIAE